KIMSDDELIRLVESKAPEELTLEELELLRARLAESPELQQALASSMRMSQYLSDYLGGSRIKADDILARAGAKGVSRSSGRTFAAWILCAVLVAALAAVTWKLRAPEDPPAAASVDDESAVEAE